ncbi:hypothetical protein CesoFtcFv8_018959 [Champsocephalus esox]|nr:hypothetical protein CesoFtcFv8_018959 [Champsocephalus esox]
MREVLTHLVANPGVPAAQFSGPAGVGSADIPVQVPVHSPTIRLASPEKFSGESGNCRPFLVQCDLHFKHQPAAFPTDQAKIAFIVSHLTGRAEAWATAEWSRNSPVCQSVRLFLETMSKIFDLTPALVNIKQRQRRVMDYAIEFRTLAAESGWNSAALFDAFLHGLSDPIKDQLAPLQLPEDVDSLIAMAIRVDQRLAEREREKGRNTGSTPPCRQELPREYYAWQRNSQSSSPERPAPPIATEEPMQLGRARLTPEECQRRLREQRCFYCGQQGHVSAACSVKDRAHQREGGRW